MSININGIYINTILIFIIITAEDIDKRYKNETGIFDPFIHDIKNWISETTRIERHSIKVFPGKKDKSMSINIIGM